MRRDESQRGPVSVRRRGFTLIEVMMSMAIMGIIMLACSSVMVLCARAIGSGTIATDVSLQAGAARKAVDQVVEDLKMAKSITEQSSTAVTFVVPDRNGDGVDETIRYSWSGTAGGPLVREVNGEPAGGAVIADHVQSLNLDYLVKTVGPPPPVESGEYLLESYDGGTFAYIRLHTLNSTSWVSEYFRVVFPDNAISWKITRMKVMLRGGSPPAGMVTVELRAADSAKKPTGGSLGSASVDATAIPGSPSWIDVPFNGLGGLDPLKGYCVVVRATTGGSPAYACYDDYSNDGTLAYSTTTNSGGSWSAPTVGKAQQFYVYGTVTRQP